MPRYKQKPDVPIPVVWLVNPDGRVVDMTSDFPQVGKARGGMGGWKLATEEQIETAKAEREAKNEAHFAKQARVRAVKQTAAEMTVAASELIKEEGASAPSPPKPGKKKGDAA